MITPLVAPQPQRLGQQRARNTTTRVRRAHIIPPPRVYEPLKIRPQPHPLERQTPPPSQPSPTSEESCALWRHNGSRRERENVWRKLGNICSIHKSARDESEDKRSKDEVTRRKNGGVERRYRGAGRRYRSASTDHANTSRVHEISHRNQARNQVGREHRHAGHEQEDTWSYRGDDYRELATWRTHKSTHSEKGRTWKESGDAPNVTKARWKKVGDSQSVSRGTWGVSEAIWRACRAIWRVRGEAWGVRADIRRRHEGGWNVNKDTPKEASGTWRKHAMAWCERREREGTRRERADSLEKRSDINWEVRGGIE